MEPIESSGWRLRRPSDDEEEDQPPSKRQGTLDAWLSSSPDTNLAPAERRKRHIEAEIKQRLSAGRPISRGPREDDEESSSQRDNGSTPTQQVELAATARETKAILPEILKEIPDVHAGRSHAYTLASLPPLVAANCPRYRDGGKVTLKVINQDTFNAAIDLAHQAASGNESRVAVLNMANYSRPGGGWLNGAMAQEEAMCYRSSLALSLHKRYYPWQQRMGIYSPDVVIIRSDVPSGHKLLVPDIAPANLPVVSALSIAAPYCPRVSWVRPYHSDGVGGSVLRRPMYTNPAVRVLMKDKMRLCLRMAAERNHRLLVLGALGCGAFRNPTEEVAHCWLEVFREAEFQGGWWEEVWFAVYDRNEEGNFNIFEKILGGVEV